MENSLDTRKVRRTYEDFKLSMSHDVPLIYVGTTACLSKLVYCYQPINNPFLSLKEFTPAGWKYNRSRHLRLIYNKLNIFKVVG